MAKGKRSKYPHRPYLKYQGPHDYHMRGKGRPRFRRQIDREREGRSVEEDQRFTKR